MPLEVGQKAPEFAKLADFAGQWLVLYFYPKDNTPGCTTEAIDFTALSPQFQQLNAVIIGVSPDSEKSHCRFIEKTQFNYSIIERYRTSTGGNLSSLGIKKIYG